MKTIKGYKALNKDMTCRGVKFEVGREYTIEGPLKMCYNGYHFCANLLDVYNYYSKTTDTVVVEIEAYGDILTEGDKSCTGCIIIRRILSHSEILKELLSNSGSFNSGHSNSGSYNSGHSNSGNYNSGSSNSGNYNSGSSNSGSYNSGYSNSGHSNSGSYNYGHSNSGNYNSGSSNSGNYNSGSYNSGYSNSGNYNSGSSNSGNYNSGSYNSGFFNTKDSKVRLFNKDTDITFDDPRIAKLRQLRIKPRLLWVNKETMTEKEKIDYPFYKTTRGYLKDTGKLDWSSVSKEDLEFIKSLPNFDPIIFKEITGLDLSDEIEVVVNGISKKIKKEDAKKLGLIE